MPDPTRQPTQQEDPITHQPKTPEPDTTIIDTPAPDDADYIPPPEVNVEPTAAPPNEWQAGAHTDDYDADPHVSID